MRMCGCSLPGGDSRAPRRSDADIVAIARPEAKGPGEAFRATASRVPRRRLADQLRNLARYGGYAPPAEAKGER